MNKIGQKSCEFDLSHLLLLVLLLLLFLLLVLLFLLLLLLLGAVAVAVLGVTVLVVSVLVLAVLGVAVGLLLGGLDLLGGLLSGGGTAERKTEWFNKAESIHFSWKNCKVRGEIFGTGTPTLTKIGGQVSPPLNTYTDSHFKK